MQNKIGLRTKTLLAICLFAVIFAGFVCLATFFDLDISRILTKGSLAEGEYISHNGFALFFEAIGCAPFYIMIAIAAVIAFWFFARKQNKGLYVVAAICALAAAIALTLLFKDLFSYTAEYLGANLVADSMGVLKAHELAGSIYIMALSFVPAAAVAAGMIALWKRIPRETNDKMIWWALAIVTTLVFYLIVHFVKSPIGRVRYRTMNYLGNFDLFTRWYEINGKRVLTPAGVVASTPETKAALIVASDTCKSFPSGHTFSAGMIYTLLGLPYVCDKCNKKGVKLALWVCTIGYTAIVAISRIAAGAHYFSDVLFGGTIAFVGAMITREIFVCKGSHCKALFGKAPVAVSAAVPQEAPEQAVEQEVEQAAEPEQEETETIE